MNIKNNHLVIMAGGVGSRFWPMSTPDYPKQFIDVLGCGRTLIQLTADRFQGICPPENIWVVTSEKYADTVKEQLPDIADDHILREPCRRNTAPCIAYVSWKIKARNPKANMVVTPSDHIDRNFPLCENISVDYAIMEKADEIFVLPASFGWSDLGTWGSLHENLPKDAHNNTQIGENIKLYETRNCVIHTTQEKRVVVQGLDGYIVAEKNNTLLICRLSEEQRIKEFSAE